MVHVMISYLQVNIYLPIIIMLSRKDSTDLLKLTRYCRLAINTHVVPILIFGEKNLANLVYQGRFFFFSC